MRNENLERYDCTNVPGVDLPQQDELNIFQSPLSISAPQDQDQFLT